MSAIEMGATGLPMVYVVGDSISMQYGPYLEQGVRGSWQYDRKSGNAEALLNLDIPMGANAGDSCKTLDYLRALLGKGDFQPDVLLVNCGLHDIKRNPQGGEIQVGLDEYRANLEEIIKLCRKAGVLLAWMRTTPVVDEVHNVPGMQFHRHAADLESYNACADAAMESARVPVIDLCAFTRRLGNDRELFCDHVHYHEAIRARQGAFLAGWLLGFKSSGKLS